MRQRLGRWCVAVCVLLGATAAPAAAAPRVDRQEGEPPVVYLEGGPYELGLQHGRLLQPEVHASVEETLAHFRGALRVPLVSGFLINRWLDWIYAQAEPFIPPDYKEEMRGLAEGSGVPLREIHRLHAIPDATGTGCSSLAVFGHATTDGRLYHTRNLDWNIKAGVQRHAAVFVVHPARGVPFINVGYAGFIGVLSGINAHGVSVAQIGAETADETFAGMPMPFVLRQVLQTSPNLDLASWIVMQVARTRGYNYVFADAITRQAIALETTRRVGVLFRPDDPKEHRVPYALPIADAVVRADTAMDRGIRSLQRASGGQPGQHPSPSPIGSGAYEQRYKGQATRIQAQYGRLDVLRVRQIAQAVAPPSNVQSVVYAYPDLWVANAEGKTPAAQTDYRHYAIDDLLNASAP